MDTLYLFDFHTPVFTSQIHWPKRALQVSEDVNRIFIYTILKNGNHVNIGGLEI